MDIHHPKLLRNLTQCTPWIAAVPPAQTPEASASGVCPVTTPKSCHLPLKSIGVCLETN